MEDIQRDRARLDKHWRQRLERARSDAEDAERRYRAVDPENRLVARSLEQRWEETLRAERQVRDDYDRFLREQPPQLRRGAGRIAALSSDLPALWHAPDTTDQDRKEIVRHLVEKVVVHVKNDSEYVDVTIHWHGGFTSQHEVVRPVKSYEQLRDFDKLMDRIAALRHEGHTAAQIADCLNQEGFSPPKRAAQFFPELVRQLLSAAAWRTRRRTPTNSGRTSGGCRSWPKQIPVSAGKLADWARRGWVHSRRTPAQRLWILWADKAGIEATPQARDTSRRGIVEYPAALTVPSATIDRRGSGAPPPRRRENSMGFPLFSRESGLARLLRVKGTAPVKESAILKFLRDNGLSVTEFHILNTVHYGPHTAAMLVRVAASESEQWPGRLPVASRSECEQMLTSLLSKGLLQVVDMSAIARIEANLVASPARSLFGLPQPGEIDFTQEGGRLWQRLDSEVFDSRELAGWCGFGESIEGDGTFRSEYLGETEQVVRESIALHPRSAILRRSSRSRGLSRSVPGGVIGGVSFTNMATGWSSSNVPPRRSNDPPDM